MSFQDYFSCHWSAAIAIALAFALPIRAEDSTAGARIADLPVAASSFGAVACDGWVYVYGGHIAPVHTYSTEAVSRTFHRLNLAEPARWEELPGGPGLQGMNLAAFDGKIYRVGGMEPRNKPGDPTDNHSIADCACFDPALRKWQSLPSLPEPRSSHDVVVVDGKLYVVGGWNMRGADGEDWLPNALMLDLRAQQSGWQVIPQPFVRRALIVAARGGRIYAMGGFTEENQPVRRVDILDIGAKTWSVGPDLPGADHNGFAPAACTLGDKVYASVADGSLYMLDESQASWQQVAKLAPRIVHRLVPDGSQILVVGGARAGKNLSSIEVVAAGKAASSKN